MNALLFIAVFWWADAVSTQAVPYPTMAGCERAAAAIKQKLDAANLAGRRIEVVCTVYQ